MVICASFFQSPGKYHGQIDSETQSLQVLLTSSSDLICLSLLTKPLEQRLVRNGSIHQLPFVEISQKAGPN